MRCKNGYRQDPPKSGKCVPKTKKMPFSPKRKTTSKKNMTTLNLTHSNLVLLGLKPEEPTITKKEPKLKQPKKSRNV